MSQEDVFLILKELGGEAPTDQIKKIAKEKYPRRSLHGYVLNRLRKLEKWGYVKKVETEHGAVWKIMKKSYS